MRRAPLAAVVSAGLVFGSACGAETQQSSSSDSKFEQALRRKPPSNEAIKSLAEHLAQLDRKLEAKAATGHLHATAAIGTCALVLDKRTEDVNVILNPGLVRYKDKTTGNAVLQVFGYSGKENKMIFGDPSEVSTDKQNIMTTNKISLGSEFTLIFKNDYTVKDIDADSTPEQSFRDINSDRLVMTVGGSSSLAQGQSFNEFTNSDFPKTICEAAWPQANPAV